jgi:hypothetical protein
MEPIHGSGTIVSMDSGFCVTAGILALHDKGKGVYRKALTKKQGRYWPKGVRGITSTTMSTLWTRWLAVGEFDCYVQDMAGKKFMVHCHKEDKYVQKVMSTHGLMVGQYGDVEEG